MSRTTTWQVVVFPLPLRDNSDMQHLSSPFERHVVVRRIDQPLATLHVPEVDTFGPLRLTGPFTRAVSITEGWAAPGRIGRVPVDVELDEWSDRVAELRIVPRSRHVDLWTKRRQRRYFDDAHRAATALACVLAAARLRPVRSTPRPVATTTRQRATA
jgi:hypothetical protein